MRRFEEAKEMAEFAKYIDDVANDLVLDAKGSEENLDYYKAGLIRGIEWLSTKLIDNRKIDFDVYCLVDISNVDNYYVKCKSKDLVELEMLRQNKRN